MGAVSPATQGSISATEYHDDERGYGWVVFAGTLLLLLGTPSESLAVEYKSWLDLSQNSGKAILAKAAIALANDSIFALTGGIYSRSPVNIERAKAELVCGIFTLTAASPAPWWAGSPSAGSR